MLNYALLAGAVALSAPAFAQDKPGKDMAPTMSQPTTVDQAVPNPAPAASESPAKADSALPPSTVAQEAATAAPAAATQVAEVVNKEFASYDKDGDGALSAAEFDAWMVALKTASDPTTKASAPATKTWLTQAFAQADTDRNKKVSKTELTGFLSAQG